MCDVFSYTISTFEKAKICSCGQNIMMGKTNYKIQDVGGRRWTERSRTVRNPPRGRRRKEAMITDNWKDLNPFRQILIQSQADEFFEITSYLIRTVTPLWRWVILSMMRRTTRSVCGLVCDLHLLPWFFASQFQFAICHHKFTRKERRFLEKLLGFCSAGKLFDVCTIPFVQLTESRISWLIRKKNQKFQMGGFFWTVFLKSWVIYLFWEYDLMSTLLGWPKTKLVIIHLLDFGFEMPLSRWCSSSQLLLFGILW